MKYKDLPKEITITKLISTSFSSPSINKKVFDWCNQVLPLIHFVENERIKLVKKYGVEDKETLNVIVPRENLKSFAEDFEKVIDMDITDELKDFPLDEKSFDDENCEYPKDKSLWLSPSEIGYLFRFIKK